MTDRERRSPASPQLIANGIVATIAVVATAGRRPWRRWHGGLAGSRGWLVAQLLVIGFGARAVQLGSLRWPGHAESGLLGLDPAAAGRHRLTRP